MGALARSLCRTLWADFRDLLFDSELERINTVLATVADGETPRGLPRSVEDALLAGAPVYRRRYWPEADERNRAFVSALRPLVDACGATFREPHAIVDQDTGTVGATILHAAERAGHAEPDQFWHAVIFYSAGAVAVETLRARGHAYAMYADVNGLFARAWPAYRAPLVAHWQPFLDGRGDFHAALERCVATLV